MHKPDAQHHNDDKPLICYKTLSSPKWKSNYKDRTYTERINNAVLNTYGLHKMHLRNGENGFSLSLQGINLRLDAWLKAEI